MKNNDGRYKELDLDFYRNSMNKEDYEFYIDFIGEEEIWFDNNEFEIYYPDGDK